MRAILRLLTVICYILPFTFFVSTCNNDYELKYAYNQAEANKNRLTETHNTEMAENTTKVNAPPVALSQDTATNSLSEVADNLLNKLIRPTDRSLSGVGCVLFYKNITGKICIAVCLLISLILLLGFKLIRSKKATQYLLLATIICQLIFIANSFISKVSLLWGCWILLVLLLIQIIVEAKRKAKA